jgi:hypothetical protein
MDSHPDSGWWRRRWRTCASPRTAVLGGCTHGLVGGMKVLLLLVVLLTVSTAVDTVKQILRNGALFFVAEVAEVGIGNTDNALTNAENVSIFFFFYSNSVKFEFFFFWNSWGHSRMKPAAPFASLHAHWVIQFTVTGIWVIRVPLVAQLRCLPLDS